MTLYRSDFIIKDPLLAIFVHFCLCLTIHDNYASRKSRILWTDLVLTLILIGGKEPLIFEFWKNNFCKLLRPSKTVFQGPKGWTFVSFIFMSALKNYSLNTNFRKIEDSVDRFGADPNFDRGTPYVIGERSGGFWRHEHCYWKRWLNLRKFFHFGPTIFKKWTRSLSLKFFLLSEMVFCYQNCSDLLWERFVLVIKKNFEIRGWRPRICKNFEITRGQNNFW